MERNLLIDSIYWVKNSDSLCIQKLSQDKKENTSEIKFR